MTYKQPKIISSDGSLNVDYSDINNIDLSALVPSGPSTPITGLRYVNHVLTSSEVKNLHTTPITLVAAQGSGNVILVIGTIAGKLTYGGNNPFTGGGVVALNYASNAAVTTNLLSNAATLSSANRTTLNAGQVFTSNVDFAALDNNAIVATNVGAAFTGNAADDNTVSVSFMYMVVSL